MYMYVYVHIEISTLSQIYIYIKPYRSKYLLRKCLGYNLLKMGGLRTFSNSVWIHRVYIYM